MEINILVLLVEAIATNKKVHKYINEEYEKNKYKAYKLAKSHENYNHLIFCDGSIIKEEMCKKALGLLLLNDEDDSFFINLLKTGWEDFYKYLNRHRSKEIDVTDINLKFIENKHMTDDYINSIYAILISFEDIFDYHIIKNDDFNTISKLIYMRILYYDSVKDSDSAKEAMKYNVAKFNFDSLHQKTKDKAIKLKKQILNDDVKNISELFNFNKSLTKDVKYDYIFDTENLLVDSMLYDQKINNRDFYEL